MDELKTEFGVQKTFTQDSNKIIWVMYNNEDISYLEEFLMFIDGVLVVDVVKGKLNSVDEKDEDTVGDEDTTGDEEKGSDTVGDEDTTGDEEKGNEK